MSVVKLPSGRWRAQVWDPEPAKNVSVSQILGPAFKSFRTKTEAKEARTEARRALRQRRGKRSDVTVAQWRARWLSDPLFARRWKESTRNHHAERTKRFAEKYGDLPIRHVEDAIVAEWLGGGKNVGTVSSLLTMFNDARRKVSGRLIVENPFAELGLHKSSGNGDVVPPDRERIDELIAAAEAKCPPSYAAWLKFAAYTGMRPGEIDGLRWDCIDWERGRIHVKEQWNVNARAFTTPKNSQAREAILTAPAREALMNVPRDREFCFVNARGTHWRPSSRERYWSRVRAACDEERTLYLCTRHFAGSYMVNVLLLPTEDVAIVLGHTDGGDLVRSVYGHRDKGAALDRAAAAYARLDNVVSLDLVREAESA